MTETVEQRLAAVSTIERFPGTTAMTGFGEWDAGEDGEPIPPRGWLLGSTFCRRYLSSIIATGGMGKTALRIAQALALATGRPLTGEQVFQRCRVLIVSLEDDRDELRRRVRAAMKHHNIAAEEVRGWLFLATPAAEGWRLAAFEDGKVTPGELGPKLRETIERLKIDLVILDPFVKTHAVEENGNGQIDIVAGILARLAADCDCAIDAPHHVAKGASDPGNADRGRGASSFKDAARLVYTLNIMAPEDALTFGIGEAERRLLIRMDSAKVNLAPPAGAAKWFRLVGVNLGNGTDAYPHGDEVQTVEPWTPPNAWAGLSHFKLNEILTDIDKGFEDDRRYSAHNRAGDRAAWRVVQRHAPDKTNKQAQEIVNAWIKNGVLAEKEYHDLRQRKDVKGLWLDPTKRPS